LSGAHESIYVNESMWACFVGLLSQWISDGWCRCL